MVSPTKLHRHLIHLLILFLSIHKITARFRRSTANQNQNNNSYSSTITTSPKQDFINIIIKDDQLNINNILIKLEKYDAAIYNLLSFYVKKNGRLVKSKIGNQGYFRLEGNVVIANKRIDREEVCKNNLIGSFEVVKVCEVYLEVSVF